MTVEWITSTKLLEEMKSSQNGDAWQSFCSRFRPMLMSFAVKLGLPPSLAEDAAQETMKEFTETFDRYERNRGRLSSWLFGIARRVMLNMGRNRPPEQLIANRRTGTGFFESIEDEKAIRHTWNSEWQRLVLKYCIMKIREEFSPRVYEAFELFALLGNSAEEVAQQLNTSVGAVYTATSRVRKRLKEIRDDFEKTF